MDEKQLSQSNNVNTNQASAQKLLPAPQNHPKKYDTSEVKLFVKILVGSLLFIVGFSFSNTAFFEDHPLFGVRFLAEFLLSSAAGLFGFFILPVMFLEFRSWVENVMSRIIADIVNNFWTQQSKRMQDVQREKQKKKTNEAAQKKAEEDKKRHEDFEHGILIDTSVLVDGRLLDIVKTGFFDKSLIIPKVVIDELHLISDSEDKLKRQRGRRGLDVIRGLKTATKVFVPTDVPNDAQVDKELITLAKRYKIKLMTLDFNLNKVAKIAGVKVLNINDLVNSVKTVVLPGEFITVSVIQEGKEKEQGVGYMPDGTMIVVEGARDKVGQEITAKVSRVIQGPAGKMIFCKLDTL